jgi:hypothetical protein
LAVILWTLLKKGGWRVSSYNTTLSFLEITVVFGAVDIISFK